MEGERLDESDEEGSDEEEEEGDDEAIFETKFNTKSGLT